MPDAEEKFRDIAAAYEVLSGAVQWCSRVWSGVVGCGRVWSGVVWCGGVWCGGVGWGGVGWGGVGPPPACALSVAVSMYTHLYSGLVGSAWRRAEAHQ